jgi:alpha-galactosidase
MGLSLGVTLTAGSKTCHHDKPGSMEKELNDIELLNTWGISYISVEDCNVGIIPSAKRFGDISKAVRKLSPDTFLTFRPSKSKVWAASSAFKLANSWTPGTPSEDSFTWVEYNFFNGLKKLDGASKGSWIDLDTMQLGRNGLTLEEEATHLVLWAISKSPLFISSDLSGFRNQTLDLATNKEILELNQDQAQVAPKCV